jgi:prepilin-type N-terminal cleavage/methylation domain-containing protein
MSQNHKEFVAGLGARRWRRWRAGFTLVELLVTLMVFLVISGAAFSLISKHMPIFATQQSQSGLNFSLRNAVAQMQIDVVNAGEGFYPGADVAAWPVGVTIKNNVSGSTCYDSVSKTYGQSCFDTLTVIATDRSTSPAGISDSGGNPLASSVSTSTSSDLFVKPSGTMTASQLAASLKNGNQILIVEASGGKTLMTTAILSADATASGGVVHLTHYATQTYNGIDESQGGGWNSSSNDPLGLSTNKAQSWTSNPSDPNSDLVTLTDQFDSNGWVLKLAPVKYSVDASDPTNPKLIRTDSSDCPTANPCTIAEQIVGFKVGASVWNRTGNDDTVYNYDNVTTPYAWSDVRAVRITLIGRTDPNAGTTTFSNNFDGGNYRIQAVSVVVNPRNLSMND